MAHLLDLKTLTERPTIGIDGTAYEMRTPDEMSIVDSQRFQYFGKRMDIGQGGDELPTDESAQEMAHALESLLDLVMVSLPDHVRDRLTDAQKVQIVEAFTQLFPHQRRAGGAEKANGAVKTSASRSAGSRGSTAATPTAG